MLILEKVVVLNKDFRVYLLLESSRQTNLVYPNFGFEKSTTSYSMLILLNKNKNRLIINKDFLV